MGMETPPEIEDRYDGKWIAWDTETDEVVGADEDLGKVVEQAQPARRAGHLVYYHTVLPRGAVFAGGDFTEIRK